MTVPIFYPKNKQEWRKWLENNQLKNEAVWIVFYNKNAQKKSITWREAVDVALCFGWIDSKKVKIDEYTSHQYFSKRKANSTWSKINKEIVAQLITDGLMTDTGMESIETAKQNGSWTILDEVEALVIPNDLAIAFKKHKKALTFFQNLSKSKKKMLLQWIVLAKRPETRQKRIDTIASSAGKEKLPLQFM